MKHVGHDALELGQRAMPGVGFGFGVGREAFVIPRPHEHRIVLEARATRELFKPLLAPIAAVTAKRLQTGGDTDPRAGQNEQTLRPVQQRRGCFDRMRV
jgi:hypothetical protein